jgi:hypothetical protein
MTNGTMTNGAMTDEAMTNGTMTNGAMTNGKMTDGACCRAFWCFSIDHSHLLFAIHRRFQNLAFKAARSKLAR